MTIVSTLSTTWTERVNLQEDPRLEQVTRAISEAITSQSVEASLQGLTLFQMVPPSVTLIGKSGDSVILLLSINALAWRKDNQEGDKDVSRETTNSEEVEDSQTKDTADFPDEIESLISEAINKGYSVEYSDKPK